MAFLKCQCVAPSGAICCMLAYLLHRHCRNHMCECSSDPQLYPLSCRAENLQKNPPTLSCAQAHVTFAAGRDCRKSRHCLPARGCGPSIAPSCLHQTESMHASACGTPWSPSMYTMGRHWMWVMLDLPGPPAGLAYSEKSKTWFFCVFLPVKKRSDPLRTIQIYRVFNL